MNFLTETSKKNINISLDLVFFPEIMLKKYEVSSPA